MIKLFEGIGNHIIVFVEHLGALVMLLLETLSYILRGAVSLKLTVEQMAFLGVNSSFIVIITTGFTGMVMCLELAYMAVKYGVSGTVGIGVAISMARELAPMLTAVVVAGRVGSAIAAQLGSMKVTEQIDALLSLATSPVQYLVVPRLIACMIMVPILTIFADYSGVFGGYIVAVHSAGISPEIYFDSIDTFLLLSDVTGGLWKAFIFGILIALISCHQGLTTSGGAAGVGVATTKAVVISIIAIFVSNYFLSDWLYGGNK